MSSKNNNRIAKNSLFLYLRMLFNLGVSLYTSRVVLNILGVEDFGLFNVVGGVIMMFSFLNNSMAGATQRFLSFEIGKREKGDLPNVFNLSVSIHLLIACIMIILSETVGLWFVYNKLIIPPDRLQAALWVYHFAVLVSALNVINVPFFALIMAKERMHIFAYLSILETVLKLVVVFLLLVFSFDHLKLYALFTALITVIIFLLYQFICRRLFIVARIKKLVWNQSRFKEMGSFAMWVMNGNLAVVGYTQGLNILLNLFFGPTVNAARGIAMQVQNAIMGFSSSFQSSVNPQITKSYATQDYDYMHTLVFASSKIAFFLLFMVSLPILIETDFLLTIWLKLVPEHTVSFVRLTILTCLITPLSNAMIVSVHATGNLKKFQIWEGSILLLIVPISYLFLKMGFRAEIVFVVHLLVSILVQIIRVQIIAPLIYMNKSDYFFKVILRIIYVVPLVFIVSFTVFNNLENGWLRLFCVSLVSLFSMFLFVYVLGLNNKEQSFIKERMSRIVMKS